VNDLDTRSDDSAPGAAHDDLRALRALWAAPAPDPARLAAVRSRLTAEAAREREAPAASAGPVRAGGRRWNWFPAHPVARRALFAGATAAAVTAGLLVALPGGSGGSGDAGTAGGPRTVATVLAAAARNAENTPVVRPRPDQWVLHDEVGCMNPGCVYGTYWVRGAGGLRADGDVNGSSPVRVYRTALNDLPLDRLRNRPVASYDALDRLPTEPRALLKRLSTDPDWAMIPTGWGHGKPRHLGNVTMYPVPQPDPAGHAPYSPAQQFDNIVHIMEYAPVIPARIDAALFRAVALIPGIRVLERPMADAFGRPSIALTIDSAETAPGLPGVVNHFTNYLFLDPTTYAYRGSLDVDHSHDGDDRWETGRRSVPAVVDQAGTVPGGARWKPYPLPTPGPVEGR
jgi:hypothetical protein